MAAPAYIKAEDLDLLVNPLDRVDSLSGVRIEDVGQGDAIAILDGRGRPVVRIDYGGVQSSPFKGLSPAKKRKSVNAALPVADTNLLMLTHWDEDHWASATETSRAVQKTSWLVPRQWTSPGAVERSLAVRNIACIPPTLEQVPVCFVARNGDQLWWEKLKPFRTTALNENCNRTGVAFSVVKAASSEVIFLPGDAPFHLAAHYKSHGETPLVMRGLVAFHHGAGTHWAKATRQFLRRWRNAVKRQTIVYSVGDPNRDSHPVVSNYEAEFPQPLFSRVEFVRTSGIDPSPRGPVEILF